MLLFAMNKNSKLYVVVLYYNFFFKCETVSWFIFSVFFVVVGGALGSRYAMFTKFELPFIVLNRDKSLDQARA